MSHSESCCRIPETAATVDCQAGPASRKVVSPCSTDASVKSGPWAAGGVTRPAWATVYGGPDEQTRRPSGRSDWFAVGRDTGHHTGKTGLCPGFREANPPGRWLSSAVPSPRCRELHRRPHSRYKRHPIDLVARPIKSVCECGAPETRSQQGGRLRVQYPTDVLRRGKRSGTGRSRPDFDQRCPSPWPRLSHQSMSQTTNAPGARGSTLAKPSKE